MCNILTLINRDGKSASTEENLGMLRKILHQTSPATRTEHEIKTSLIISK
jgi:hypothetical protein